MPAMLPDAVHYAVSVEPDTQFANNRCADMGSE